jgi:hypothetical protein
VHTRVRVSLCLQPNVQDEAQAGGKGGKAGAKGGVRFAAVRQKLKEVDALSEEPGVRLAVGWACTFCSVEFCRP